MDVEVTTFIVDESTDTDMAVTVLRAGQEYLYYVQIHLSLHGVKRKEIAELPPLKHTVLLN